MMISTISRQPYPSMGCQYSQQVPKVHFGRKVSTKSQLLLSFTEK